MRLTLFFSQSAVADGVPGIRPPDSSELRPRGVLRTGETGACFPSTTLRLCDCPDQTLTTFCFISKGPPGFLRATELPVPERVQHRGVLDRHVELALNAGRGGARLRSLLRGVVACGRKRERGARRGFTIIAVGGLGQRQQLLCCFQVRQRQRTRAHGAPAVQRLVQSETPAVHQHQVRVVFPKSQHCLPIVHGNYAYTLRKTDTFLFTPRFFLYVLLAGLLSSFFYGQNRTLVGIFNSIGILFISVILPCFMAQVFVEEMKFDREVYTREFNDAYYRAGTYVAHRVLVEVRIGAFPNPGTLFTRTRLTLSFTYLRSPP